jgi:hypothetical protein
MAPYPSTGNVVIAVGIRKSLVADLADFRRSLGCGTWFARVQLAMINQALADQAIQK